MRQELATKPARQRAPRAASKPTADEEVIQTSFRLPRSRWTRLQTLSIGERITVQSIIVSALEAEFSRRGLPF